MTTENTSQDEVKQVSSTPEVVEQTEQQAVPEFSDLQKKAMEMGWDPNHQGRTFVSAEEYVNRAPLFKRIEDQNKKITELTELTRQTAQHFTTMRKDAYDRALQDFEAKRIRAIEDGDKQQTLAIEAQANALRTRMSTDTSLRAPVTPPATVAPDIQDWASRNQGWYNTNTVENAKMVAAAESIDNYLAKQAKIDNITINRQDHLSAIESEVKRLFPHRFENAKRDSLPTVGRSTSGSNEGTTLTGLAKYLTPEQIQLGNHFNKSNPKYTLEMYAKDLEQIKRLNKK